MKGTLQKIIRNPTIVLSRGGIEHERLQHGN